MSMTLSGSSHPQTDWMPGSFLLQSFFDEDRGRLCKLLWTCSEPCTFPACARWTLQLHSASLDGGRCEQQRKKDRHLWWPSSPQDANPLCMGSGLLKVPASLLWCILLASSQDPKTWPLLFGILALYRTERWSTWSHVRQLQTLPAQWSLFCALKTLLPEYTNPWAKPCHGRQTLSLSRRKKKFTIPSVDCVCLVAG